MIQDFVSKYSAANLPQAVEKAVVSLLPAICSGGSQYNLLEACKRLGIDVRTQHRARFEGCLTKSSRGTYRITLRDIGSAPSDVAQRRARFTLAHELGHWVVHESLHRSNATLFRGMPVTENETREEEELADAIAAEILMPRHKMGDLTSSDLSHDILAVGTTRFDVNRQAFICRYAELTNKSILYLKLLPTKFRKIESPAKVDDAWISHPNHRPHRIRGSVHLRHELPFTATQSPVLDVPVTVNGQQWNGPFASRFHLGLVPKALLISQTATAKEINNGN